MLQNTRILKKLNENLYKIAIYKRKQENGLITSYSKMLPSVHHWNLFEYILCLNCIAVVAQ